MAMAQYKGVAGVARKSAKQYEGIDGIARTVRKGYLGVNGVGRQYFGGGTILFTAEDGEKTTYDIAPDTLIVLEKSGTLTPSDAFQAKICVVGSGECGRSGSNGSVLNGTSGGSGGSSGYVYMRSCSFTASDYTVTVGAESTSAGTSKLSSLVGDNINAVYNADTSDLWDREPGTFHGVEYGGQGGTGGRGASNINGTVSQSDGEEGTGLGGHGGAGGSSDTAGADGEAGKGYGAGGGGGGGASAFNTGTTVIVGARGSGGNGYQGVVMIYITSVG